MLAACCLAAKLHASNIYTPFTGAEAAAKKWRGVINIHES